MTPPPGTTDESLLRQIGDGRSEAAAALYERYADRLEVLVRGHLSRRLSARVDAADIVQSVFRRFLTAARDGRYTLPSGQELWGLLAAIALNRLRSAERHHRAGKRDVRQTAGLDEAHVPAAAADPFGLVVDDALARLPDHHRAVIKLRLDGYEVAEIADQMSQSKRTIERVLQDARRRLRTVLEAEADDDPADPAQPDGRGG